MSITGRWGEIRNNNGEQLTPNVTSEITRSMTKFAASDISKQEPDDDREKISKIILPSMDPLMLYSILLHKYYHQLHDLIQETEVAINSFSIVPSEEPPLLPELPDIMKRYEKNASFIPKEYKLLSPANEIDVPELSHSVVQEILYKSVGVMLAHAGFQNTHQSNINLLRDVLDSFLKKIAYRLRVATDDEEKGHSCDFPSPIEKVLVDLGMNGIAGLHDYYQSRVVKYILVLRKRCIGLLEHYKSLFITTQTSVAAEIKHVEIDKMEETDVPTVLHVPSTDGEIGYSFMETGFQLLNSLEAANLQGLKEDTDTDP